MPCETQTPLAVDANAVLAFAVAPQSFQLIARWNAQAVQLCGSVQLQQLAAGIHLVFATQRPDAKTFSGLIRSNIPARIALTVQKGSESVIILDQPGAEDLLGAGDMLIKAKPGSPPDRIHGARIERKDIERHLKRR